MNMWKKFKRNTFVINVYINRFLIFSAYQFVYEIIFNIDVVLAEKIEVNVL